jgi:selenocysteine lyase/cysteine desulfurase
MTVSEARKQFPHTWTDKIYLDHAAISPISFRVREAVGKYLEQRSLERIESYPWAPKMAHQTKGMIAERLGTSADRIAFVMNTADGLNVLASGLKWNRGDRILLYRYEYPTNVYPFLVRTHEGVEIDYYDAPDHRITADVIAKHLKPETKLLSLSAVQFSTGYTADLEAIGQLCKERGVIFCVDAIQAFPYMPLEVEKWGVDFLSCGAHKWIMAGEGTGFIYVSHRAQELIHQSWMGSTSVEHPFRHFDFELDRIRPDASRYENGTLNYPGIVSVNASMKFFGEFGFGEIHKRTIELTSRAAELFSARGVNVVSPQGERERSGILCVEIENVHEVAKRLNESNIRVAARREFLRFSPYFYTTEEEVKKAVNAVFD